MNAYLWGQAHDAGSRAGLLELAQHRNATLAGYGLGALTPAAVLRRVKAVWGDFEAGKIAPPNAGKRAAAVVDVDISKVLLEHYRNGRRYGHLERREVTAAVHQVGAAFIRDAISDTPKSGGNAGEGLPARLVVGAANKG